MVARSMLIRQAFKYRLYMSIETERFMCQYAGNCRFLRNKALGLKLLGKQKTIALVPGIRLDKQTLEAK